MSGVVVEGLDEVLDNLDRYVDGKVVSATNAAYEIAALLEEYAKSHHEWQPRSGDTDLTTLGTVNEASETIIEIYLSAGMDWDVFLETLHNGRWAWLQPTIDANRATILQILAKRLRGVR